MAQYRLWLRTTIRLSESRMFNRLFPGTHEQLVEITTQEATAALANLLHTVSCNIIHRLSSLRLNSSGATYLSWMKVIVMV